MDKFLDTIDKHPFRNSKVSPFTKEKEELRQIQPSIMLWGGGVRSLAPSRLTTAWLMTEDPLMILAGSGYKKTETRDKTFDLQIEASSKFRSGNRKYTKAKVAEALANPKPTEEQNKVVAAVLYSLKQIQIVCFDEEKKIVWTMPEDLRCWSSSQQTLWIDSKCEKMLDFEEKQPNLGLWLMERENDGWNITWPVANGTFEEIKERILNDFEHLVVTSSEVGKKPKKEDYARVLGRADAIRALSK
jgi:hypothetical protein